MRIQIALIVSLWMSDLAHSQINCEIFKNKLLSIEEQKKDIAFLKNQLLQVHINPFKQKKPTELDNLMLQLDSMTKVELNIESFRLRLEKVLEILDDEHAKFINECERDIKRPSQKSGNYSPITFDVIEEIGYLKINSFRTNKSLSIENWGHSIDSMFEVIQKRQLSRLIIDISENGGGNSLVGEILLNYITEKPYLKYSFKFRISQQYIDFANSKGFGKNIEAYKTDTLIEYSSHKHKPNNNVKNKFRGKTYIVIGENTFSSAIMFATIVQDNQIATLIGEVPTKGHPNHFGEVYTTRLPYSKLILNFSVKEWIRPNKNNRENRLIPDIPIKLVDKLPSDIVQQLILKDK